MNILYSLFYTVFSMAVVSVAALPVILFIRFIIVNTPKKFILYLWMLYLFRMVCPISMSSIFSVYPLFNRKVHIFLETVGLSFVSEGGTLKGWYSVFSEPFTVNMNFAFCSVLWAVGVIFIWCYTFVKQMRIKKWLAKSQMLGEDIYQYQKLNIPVMTGIFRQKKYIPGKIKVAEAKYILKHMDIHKERHDGIFRIMAFIITSIQWFNPLMWISYYFICRDIESAADEDTISYFGIDKKAEYAQEIINMDKGKKVINPSLVTFQENYLEDRASKMLYQNKIKKKDRQIVILLCLLIFIWWFMVRPLQLLWNGGLWDGKGNVSQVTATNEPLFSENEQMVVAKISVKNSDGLEQVVKVIMTDGDESDEGYDGAFSIVLEDSTGNRLAEEKLDNLYLTGGENKLHFNKGFEIYISDYNGDNVNEIAIGQEIEVSESNVETAIAKKPSSKKEKNITNLQEYYLWNIEGNTLQRVSEPIYLTGKTGVQANSCEFKIPKDTTGVIKSKIAGNKIFYVWDGDKKIFARKELTNEQLKEYKNVDASNENEETTHSLKNSSEREVIKVITQKDSTGSEEIKSIEITPDGVSKTFSNIKGYYCDIQWAQTTDNSERYAVLTYNGTKSQTFVIFDTKLKSVYYKQEDGNSVLSKVFKQYNGDSISFDENDIVVYTLQEKDKDILKIGFAANAKNNVTVKGSYKYDVESENQYEFSYSQGTNNSENSDNNSDSDDTLSIN